MQWVWTYSWGFCQGHVMQQVWYHLAQMSGKAFLREAWACCLARYMKGRIRWTPDCSPYGFDLVAVFILSLTSWQWQRRRWKKWQKEIGWDGPFWTEHHWACSKFEALLDDMCWSLLQLSSLLEIAGFIGSFKHNWISQSWSHGFTEDSWWSWVLGVREDLPLMLVELHWLVDSGWWETWKTT